MATRGHPRVYSRAELTASPGDFGAAWNTETGDVHVPFRVMSAFMAVSRNMQEGIYAASFLGYAVCNHEKLAKLLNWDNSRQVLEAAKAVNDFLLGKRLLPGRLVANPDDYLDNQTAVSTWPSRKPVKAHARHL